MTTANQEIKKMKQGMSYSCKEKTIILNVFKYFCKEYPNKCVTELVRRTSKATGCSEKSIFQFRKEEASAEGFKQPSKTKIRKNININSRDIKYDETVRQAIRTIIYDLKYRNIIPSLNTILKQIKADVTLPTFSLMTLRRLLFDMGFSYEKNGNKFILVEKDEKKNVTVLAERDDKKTIKGNNPALKPSDNLIENNRNEPDNRLVQHYPTGSNNILPLNILNDNNMKPMPPPMQQTTQTMQLPHMNHQVLDPQPRLLPMHMGQHEQHMMPQMHHPHSMPMMVNHNMPMQHHRLPPPTTNVDMTPWLPHHMAPQNIMK